MNAHVSQLSPTEKSKAAIAALVSGELLTPEQSRHVWLSISSLVMSARDAEHAAFLQMSELMGNGNEISAIEFNNFMRGHLNKVREQLAFIRSILDVKQ